MRASLFSFVRPIIHLARSPASSICSWIHAGEEVISRYCTVENIYSRGFTDVRFFKLYAFCVYEPTALQQGDDNSSDIFVFRVQTSSGVNPCLDAFVQSASLFPCRQPMLSFTIPTLTAPWSQVWKASGIQHFCVQLMVTSAVASGLSPCFRPSGESTNQTAAKTLEVERAHFTPSYDL